MSIEHLALACAAASGIPLAITSLNLLSWTRGDLRVGRKRTISVLIPARNEAKNIGACLDALAISETAIEEIIVYNDGSTDRTGEILEEYQQRLDNLRVLAGVPLPDGWVGKPHACHRLAEAANSEVLIFMDADVQMTPQGATRLLSLLKTDKSVATAVPRQETGSLGEKLIIPLLHLTYTSWLPLRLVEWTSDPRMVAANGQLFAMSAAEYDRLGGFAAVRHEIVDDVAFCRHAKRNQSRVVFADGYTIARCRMYRSTRDIWQGFSKNIYEGIGGSPFALLGVISLYSLAFVLPYLLLPWAIVFGTEASQLAAAFAVAANLLTRSLLALRYNHSLVSVVAHPGAVVFLLAIACNSYRWARADKLFWAGRSYAARHKRIEAGQQ